MQTPLVLIVGFLGAGKTTLLTRLVPALASLGLRPHVVLNDYQDARIDAARLANLQALVTPISGDCVCCGSREELISALAEWPATERSVMLVEANGTSDATEIHEVLTLDRRLLAYARPVQVTVVDVSRWQKRWFDRRLERDQAATASHVWLNWAERVSTSRVTAVRKDLAILTPAARLVSVDSLAAEVQVMSSDLAHAPSRVTPSNERTSSAPTTHDHAERHHFASIGVRFPDVVSRELLETLLLEFAPVLRRAKGVVTLREAPDRQFVWSYIGGDRRVRFDPLPETGFAPVAVFVGPGLPTGEIMARVRALHGG